MSTEEIALLVAGLRDQRSAVRRRSARALGVNGPVAKGAVVALIQALKDADD